MNDNYADLFYAIYNHNLEEVRQFGKLGISMNEGSSKTGDHPLHAAVVNNKK